MPVVIDTSPEIIGSLAELLPSGTHAVDRADRLLAWLNHRTDEYVVFVGPSVHIDEAAAICESLRVSSPSISVVLVRNAVDTDVLSRALQSGARDVVLYADADAIRAAVDRAQTLWVALRGPGGAAHSAEVITVFAPKGGVGKTTASVNLALTLSDHGARRVCLVDLDLAFGDVAITLQLFPKHSIEEAVGAEESLDFPMIEALLTRHDDSLMVLSAPSAPDARDRISARLISRVLRTLKQQFDYIVVDTAPNFDEQTLQALDETDELVIVATLDVPTLKNVKVALETLDLLGIAVDHRHLLLNRADDEVGLDRERVEAILGVPVTVPIPTSVDVAAATNAGNPIVLTKPDHVVSRAFKDLSGVLTGDKFLSADDPSRQAKNGNRSESDHRGRRIRMRRA